MTRDSAELQALEEGIDTVVPEMQAYGVTGGIDASRGEKAPLEGRPDPIAGLRAYLAKIDR
jgi:hypothetical protein